MSPAILLLPLLLLVGVGSPQDHIGTAEVPAPWAKQLLVPSSKQTATVGPYLLSQ